MGLEPRDDSRDVRQSCCALVEGYLDDGQLRFAGIWIENVEGLEWKSIRNATSSEYADYFDAWSAEGLRPIDIEAYQTPSGLRFAAIWWENVDGLAWGKLRNMDRDRYLQEVDDQAAAGYLMIDYERYENSSGTRYAVRHDMGTAGEPPGLPDPYGS